MDKDMHYYGTYALARAAGVRADCAHRIATASQFVDDSIQTSVIVHPDGARFRGESTAHHPDMTSADGVKQLIQINNLDDQQRVWVPFHFLPGAVGSTQSQRLRCVIDSPLAKEMVTHHLGLSDEAYAVELIGITAHVYADTFAHYGFSGVSSRVNRVKAETLLALNGDPLPLAFFDKFGHQGGLLPNFRAKIASMIGEDLSGALGHGAVATFPDQPYLEWSYRYEMPELAGTNDEVVVRKNSETFEQGAEALHSMFKQFITTRELFADEAGGFSFDDIRPSVRRILKIKASTEERIALWRTAISQGQFTHNGGEEVREYDCQEWRNATESLKNLAEPQQASGIPAYHFHSAASIHREYVLRELLPKHGIYII